MDFHFGALPPPGMDWSIGKTAASIAFFNETNSFLQTCNNPTEKEILLEATEKIKNGTLVLQDWLTPQEYLNTYIGNLIQTFKPEEQSFIKTLQAAGQLSITDNENTKLDIGITHILLLKKDNPPQLIRKRFS